MPKASVRSEAQIIPLPVLERSVPLLTEEERSVIVDAIRQFSRKIDVLEEELSLVRQAKSEQDQQPRRQFFGNIPTDADDSASPLFHSQTIFLITEEIMQLKKERDTLLVRLPRKERDSLIEQLAMVSKIRQETGLSVSSDNLKEEKRTQVMADLVSDLKFLARSTGKVARKDIYRGPDGVEHSVTIVEVFVKQDDLKARFFTISEYGYQPPDDQHLRLVVVNGVHHTTFDDLDFDMLVSLREAVGNKLKTVSGKVDSP